MSTAKPQAVSFTAREMETLALAWQCFFEDPKINYQKLAALAGYTEGSAKTIVGNLKRKLRAHAATNKPGSTDKNVPATPTSTPKPAGGPGHGKKRTAAAAAADDDDDDTVVDQTPTKKSRRAGKGKQAKKSAHMVEDDDEEFSNIRVKREELGGLQQDTSDFYNSPAMLGYRIRGAVGGGDRTMMGNGGGLDMWAYGGKQEDDML